MLYEKHLIKPPEWQDFWRWQFYLNFSVHTEDSEMSSKFETLIRDFLTESSERVCLIYDDAETEIKVTLNDLKLCVENLLNVELTSSVVGIAFDVGSKDVLSVVPSILSVLLKKVWFLFVWLDGKLQYFWACRSRIESKRRNLFLRKFVDYLKLSGCYVTV